MRKTFLMTALISASLFAESNMNKGVITKIISLDKIIIDGKCAKLIGIDVIDEGTNLPNVNFSKKYNIPISKIVNAGKKSNEYFAKHFRKGEAYNYKILSKEKGCNRIVLYGKNGDAFNYKTIMDGFAVPNNKELTSDSKEYANFLWEYATLNKTGLHSEYSSYELLKNKYNENKKKEIL